MRIKVTKKLETSKRNIKDFTFNFYAIKDEKIIFYRGETYVYVFNRRNYGA